jgi:hypothetical protein
MFAKRVKPEHEEVQVTMAMLTHQMKQLQAPFSEVYRPRAHPTSGANP